MSPEDSCVFVTGGESNVPSERATPKLCADEKRPGERPSVPDACRIWLLTRPVGSTEMKSSNSCMNCVYVALRLADPVPGGHGSCQWTYVLSGLPSPVSPITQTAWPVFGLLP